MKNFMFNKFSVVFCILILILSQQMEGQKKKSCDCQVDYSDVIAYLFPKYLVGLGNGYSLILEYKTPNQPEIQINIFHIKTGRVEVYLYEHKPRHDNDSILLQLQDIQQKNCNASFSQIIKQIKVEKTKINLTEDEVLKIRADFFDVVKKSNDFENSKLDKLKSNLVSVILDPPYYEVNYGGEGNIILSAAGGAIDGKFSEDEPQFIEWMRGVYKLVKARKAS